MVILSSSLSLAALVIAPFPGTQQDPAAELEAYAERILPDWDVPGLALAVVFEGELVLARGWGVVELGETAAVDEDTLFSIGSTTKAMTAALLGTLVDEQELGWDDAVIEHLPGFRLQDPYATREVTVRDLLTHRAGLGNADGLWYGSDRTRAEILARVSDIPPTYSLRDGFVYQNILYVAAGELSARVAGEPWEELIQARLFGPLGMRRSVPDTTSAERASNVARPHARVDGEIVTIENEILDTVAPAGAVWSSVTEMSRWMRMLLAEGEWDGARVLSPEVVAELLAPQTLIRGVGLYPYLHMLEPHWLSYGLGWFQLDYRGRAVSFHTGSIDGMSAIVGLVPDEDLGVVVLANLDHAELRHALLWKAIDLFGGEAHGRDWSAELHALYAGLAAEDEKAQDEQDSGRVADTRPSLPLERYAGTYTHALYGAARVTHADGGLRVTLGPRRAGALEHWHHDTFQLRFDRRWQGELLTRFTLNEKGEPASFELGSWTFVRSAD